MRRNGREAVTAEEQAEIDLSGERSFDMVEPLTKTGGGNWNIFSIITWKSPEFEINDIGNMRESDQIIQVNAVSYREWEPKKFYRSYNIGVNQFSL